MAFSYEAVVTPASLEMFQDSFSRYMASLGFRHMSIGGRLGAQTAHEFRTDEHYVSMSVSNEGQRHFRVIVHSDTVPVEPLVLDALTEGVADFLEPLCHNLTSKASAEIIASLVQDLRNAFQRILGEEPAR